MDKVCQLVKDGLDDSIEKIELLTFFDEKNVSAKTLKIEEFVSDQNEFSMKISKELAKRINGLESALQVIKSNQSLINDPINQMINHY